MVCRRAGAMDCFSWEAWSVFCAAVGFFAGVLMCALSVRQRLRKAVGGAVTPPGNADTHTADEEGGYVPFRFAQKGVRDFFKRLTASPSAKPFPLDGNTLRTCELPGECRIVLNIQGRFMRVSDAFCRLVGHPQSDLLGKMVSDVTVPDTFDLGRYLMVVQGCGHLQGLLMLAHRERTRILLRYEALVLSELLIEVRLDPIGGGY
jgi:PAS fold